jgi:hypothetical protein
MEHKLILSRGVNDNYFIQYSVKKSPIETDQLNSPYSGHVEFRDLMKKLRSQEGFPEGFYDVPVTLVFDEDSNDPFSEKEKEGISALVNRLQINAMLKGRSIN